MYFTQTPPCKHQKLTRRRERLRFLLSFWRDVPALCWTDDTIYLCHKISGDPFPETFASEDFRFTSLISNFPSLEISLPVNRHLPLGSIGKVDHQRKKSERHFLDFKIRLINVCRKGGKVERVEAWEEERSSLIRHTEGMWSVLFCIVFAGEASVKTVGGFLCVLRFCPSSKALLKRSNERTVVLAFSVLEWANNRGIAIWFDRLSVERLIFSYE